MQKQEFLKLTGKTDDEVSDIDYARVEALYNELDDMSKEEICRLYTDDVPNTSSVAARLIQDLKWSIAQLKDDKKKLTHRLIQNCDYEALKGVYTTSEIIKMKIEEGHAPNLTNEEVDYIKSHLQ